VPAGQVQRHPPTGDESAWRSHQGHVRPTLRRTTRSPGSRPPGPGAIPPGLPGSKDDADVPTPDPRGLTTWPRHTTSGDHDRWQPYSTLHAISQHRVRSRRRAQAMKAVVCTRYGSPDVLRFTDMEKPTPKDNQVLVKVRAVSLNGSDWEALRGKPLSAQITGPLRPATHLLGRTSPDGSRRPVPPRRDSSQATTGSPTSSAPWRVRRGGVRARDRPGATAGRHDL
jgi:hypothetical protein